MKMHKTCSIETNAITQLPENIQEIISQAQAATERAHAPYSKFYVGAAVLMDNDEIVVGNNQENAAFPSGLCAERVAILAAKANYPTNEIIAVAIAVRTDRELKQQLTPPCGACLQVMSDVEYRQKKGIPIYIKSTSDLVYIAKDVKQFLPFGFEL